MRVFLIVLDGVGIGQLPDAHKYGDEGSNSLANTQRAVGLNLPTLEAMGLGRIAPLGSVRAVEKPQGAWGKLQPRSPGKDTTGGHWELAGIVLLEPFPTYPEGFPRELVERFQDAIGRKTLGNRPASGTQIIAQLGAEHMATGWPIIYTSADSVFQIAAHEDIISPERLYEICQIARDILQGPHAVGRVIARPFVGEEGNFQRTERRRDFSLAPPGPTLLDDVKAQGQAVIAVGKIEDIFANRGITESYHTTDSLSTMEQVLKLAPDSWQGLLFANCIDTDMIWGHRNDPAGYARSLAMVDGKLAELLPILGDEDVLLIASDHGCDPTTESTDHSREYTPLLVWGRSIKPRDLGTRFFSSVGATAAEILGGRIFWGGGELLAGNFESVEFIRKVRDGESPPAEQMHSFAQAILRGEVSKPQVAAWTMAVFFQGLAPDALFALTEAMAHSGEMLDLSPIEGFVVDKHSTGGVGDKTTMVVAPWVASFGVPVIKLSGRALGHSGGTVDKLESIPGFRSQLTRSEIIAQGRELGLVLAGHSEEIAPLDAKIYQLRDSCATVESIPLIASSIISKKLAGGADAFVFDVKVGPGAFMKTMEEAEELAHYLRELAERAGRGCTVIYSSMAEPLGSAIGNALEVREAVAALQGQGPEDLVELSMALAEAMLALAGHKVGPDALRTMLASGKPRELFSQMVQKQGGKLEELPTAPCRGAYLASCAGFVEGWDTRKLGLISRSLTAERGAGIEILAKRGTRVEPGEPLAMIYAGRKEDLLWAQASLASCVRLGASKPVEIPLLMGNPQS